MAERGRFQFGQSLAVMGGAEDDWKPVADQLAAVAVPGGKGQREPFREGLGASSMEPEADRSKTRRCVVYLGRRKC